MAQSKIVNHVEKSRITHLSEAHAKPANKGNGPGIGERMSGPLESESACAAGNQPEKSNRIAGELVLGHGHWAICQGSEKNGTLGYLLLGMCEGSDKKIINDSALFEMYNKDIAECQRKFKQDYEGMSINWINGGFERMAMASSEVCGEILELIGKANERSKNWFSPDIQASIEVALKELEEIVKKKPEDLHGMWASSFWKIKWKVLRHDRIEKQEHI